MTKIDIISGFLGAGKTTLIKKLLDQAFRGEKVVLIENEFGEIGIDGGFLKDAGVEITEMNSGCICCSLVGDFGAALKKVLDDYAPDRIIIEPSGVGKLSDVIAAVEGVQKTTPALHLHSFVTVVDATKAKVYMKNFGEFFNNQVEHASAILLSRTQNMDQAKLDAAVRLLREKNPKAAILTTPWDQLTGAQIVSAMEGGHSLAEELMEEIATTTTTMSITTTMTTTSTTTTTTTMSTSIIMTTTTTSTIMTMTTSTSIITTTTGMTAPATAAAATTITTTTTTPTRCSPPGAGDRPQVQPRGAAGGPVRPGHGPGLWLYPPGQGHGALRGRPDLAALRPGARGVPDPGGRCRLHRPPVRHWL